MQIDRPNIALNSETYISIRQHELRTCKKIGYEFYCEELFVVKHKSKYSCVSAVYFNLGPDFMKENCNFAYYFNKTDITPTVLDGGNEINQRIGQTINILSAMSIMIFWLQFPVIHMY